MTGRRGRRRRQILGDIK